MSLSLRLIAEHEAAHAVVAAHYGVKVFEVWATAARGKTVHGDCPQHEDVAIAAAGDLWNREFGAVPYRDGSCGDLAYLERTVSAAGVWQARRDARAVLTRRRSSVLALAARIEEHGTLVAAPGGRLVPAAVPARVR